MDCEDSCFWARWKRGKKASAEKRIDGIDHRSWTTEYGQEVILTTVRSDAVLQRFVDRFDAPLSACCLRCS